MFSRIQTNTSTASSSAQIGQLRQALERAEAVLIGAGAGLSTSAGFIVHAVEKAACHLADGTLLLYQNHNNCHSITGEKKAALFIAFSPVNLGARYLDDRILGQFK